MSECIFCKIVNKELKSEIVFEDEKVLVFKDINPRAPIHFLIVSKEHINSINDLESKHQELMGQMILTAKKVAEQENFATKGYKLVFNVGRDGGQIVEHIHLHVLSGGYTRSLAEI